MYQIKQKQFISTSIGNCWDFFISPLNLEKITPTDMSFVVLTELPAKVYEGLMISYRVKPLLGISISWITEIKTVNEKKMFIDEQRKGPYRIWHHEHHFEALENGVMMTDIVSYELPFGFLGRIAHKLFVQKKLDNIFQFRRQQIDLIFNSELNNTP